MVDQALRLLSFFMGSVDARGRFVELDDDGQPLPLGSPPAPAPRQNLLTVTRVVHSYALGEMLGIPGGRAIVNRGLTTLWDEHRDPVAGGYVEAVGRDGPGDTTKAAYGHAHVLLAAASAVAAGHSEASALFDDALAVIDEHFWSEHDGAATTEACDREWRPLEAYRGANSNMHLCESLLAAAEVGERPISPTGRPGWRPGSSTPRLAHTAGCSPSTTTCRGSRCSSTTGTTSTTRFVPTAPPSGIRWNGRGS